MIRHMMSVVDLTHEMAEMKKQSTRSTDTESLLGIHLIACTQRSFCMDSCKISIIIVIFTHIA
jgi:heterodisulfide reductase subunit C